MTIKKQVNSGIKWNTLSTIITVLIQIIQVSILTRFLEKEDFGLMAMVMFVLGFMTMFQDLGIGVAILHKQNITKKQYSSLFWFNFIITFLLFILFIMLIPTIVYFFEDQRLSSLLYIMSFSLIISSFGRMYQTTAQKDFKFKYISLVNISSSTLGFLLVIYLAYKDYGVYALVYSSLFRVTIVNSIFFVYGIKQHGLMLYFSFIEIISFIKIGLYQLGSELINYFSKELDILIIGKFFGSEILGGYSLAKQLVFRPASFFSSIVNTIAVPVFAKIQSNLLLMQVEYMKYAKIFNTLNFLIYFLIIIFAKYIVLILYGEKFLYVTTLVQILSIYAYLRVIINFNSSLIISLGRTDIGFKWTIISGIFLSSTILIGSQFNISTLVIIMTMSMSLLFILYGKFIVCHLLKIPFKSYLYTTLPHLSLIIKYLKRGRK